MLEVRERTASIEPEAYADRVLFIGLGKVFDDARTRSLAEEVRANPGTGIADPFDPQWYPEFDADFTSGGLDASDTERGQMYHYDFGFRFSYAMDSTFSLKGFVSLPQPLSADHLRFLSRRLRNDGIPARKHNGTDGSKSSAVLIPHSVPGLGTATLLELDNDGTLLTASLVEHDEPHSESIPLSSYVDVFRAHFEEVAETTKVALDRLDPQVLPDQDLIFSAALD